jgi:hypothetical protein
MYTMKTLTIYLISLILTGCSIFAKNEISGKKVIILKGIADDKELWLENNEIRIIFSIQDIKDYIKRNDGNVNDLLVYINKEEKDTITISLPGNNFLVKDSFQEEIYPIANKLLLKGKVKIYAKNDNYYFKKVEYITIRDFSGEQSYFQAGNISFLRYILSIGE